MPEPTGSLKSASPQKLTSVPKSAGRKARAGSAGILLVGYFGFGNLGDDLLLQACVRELQGVRGGLWALSGPLGITMPAAKHPRESDDADAAVRVVYRRDWIGLLSLLLKPGLTVMIPGGEIFQSRTSAMSLAYYSFICGLGRMLGRPLYLLFQGVDPGSMTKPERAHVEGIFRSARFVSFRDQVPGFRARSSRFAATGPSADPVFGLPFPRPNPAGHDLVFVIKKSRTSGGGSSSLAGLVVRLCRKILEDDPGSRITLMIFHPADRGLNEKIARETGSDRVTIARPSASVIFREFGRPRFVLSMRYHAVVLAAIAGCRFLGLTNEDKIAGLFRFLGSADCIDLRDLARAQDPAGLLVKKVRAILGRSPFKPPLAKFRRGLSGRWTEIRKELEKDHVSFRR